IGEIGPSAREWLEWAASAGQRIWQVLPLNPVDAYGSPYASPSAFAHEPLLLSIDDLVTDGWLREDERPPDAPDGPVDWPGVRRGKEPALASAADRVRDAVDLHRWASPELATWARYQAIGRDTGLPWHLWPAPLRDRDPAALAEVEDRLGRSIGRELALQWLFDHQWGELRALARRLDVELWGDVPFFVSWWCADVWDRPDRWRLDADRRPSVVSGVPPDVFSTLGQLWGHPHYHEPTHAAEGYAWWVARFRRALSSVDRVRIDHFRGIAGVWEIAAAEPDARDGRWIPGPGRPLLEALRRVWPALPFVAEDLGVVTPDVEALRDGFDLPGMAILQFAFGDPSSARDHNPFLPHAHRRNQVVYTGTHDNDTLAGWEASADEATRDHARRYLGVHDTRWGLLTAAWRSVCDSAIVPAQDLLGLGSDARFNVPGREHGNWSWRAPRGAFDRPLAATLAEESALSGRLAR
ncbi:MAG: 4-alpha-glucanotransferase, partial [Myxococcota bacterium]